MGYLGKAMELVAAAIALGALALGLGLTPDGRSAIGAEIGMALVAAALFALGSWVESLGRK